MTLRVRPFRESDVEFAAAQAAREGWDCPGSVFTVLRAHDPEGCFIAEKEGRRVGMITSTCYARSAWLGNLIVLPECRRQGIGEALMRHALGRLEASGIETFYLEADPMGVGIYARMGFRRQFESPRFRKPAPHHALQPTADPLPAADIESIRAFDLAYFGDDRGTLLAEWLKVAIASCRIGSGERIEGYAMALPAQIGARLGPMVARSAEVAGRLLDAIVSACPDRAIIAAVPGANSAALDLFESRGFDRCPSSLCMRKGPMQGESDSETVFALANGATG